MYDERIVADLSNSSRGERGERGDLGDWFLPEVNMDSFRSIARSSAMVSPNSVSSRNFHSTPRNLCCSFLFLDAGKEVVGRTEEKELREGFLLIGLFISEDDFVGFVATDWEHPRA
jgi:hypothetical protein